MADVKISDLPAYAGNPTANDVVIINNASTSTTMKSTLKVLERGTTTSFNYPLVPVEGITMSDTINAAIIRFSPYGYVFRINSNNTCTFTNTTSEIIPLAFNVTVPITGQVLTGTAPFIDNITSLEHLTPNAPYDTAKDISHFLWRIAFTNKVLNVRAMCAQFNPTTYAFTANYLRLAPQQSVTFQTLKLYDLIYANETL